ncbi:MAG TPA: hypothetical protein DHV86_04285 [Methylophilaceae bacterium]|nr:hypothetical protein [Methylophilaceae bacterium]
MSFLKSFNIKDKILLLKEFFYDYVWKKSSLNLGIASVVFSLGLIQFTTPQFYISTTLREANSDSAMGPSLGGGAETLLSLTAAESDIYSEFRSNLYSYIVAQRMWEKGWASEVYGGGDQTKDVNKIDKRHTIAEKISALLLGYELYDYYSPHDLQGFIAGNISMRKEIRGTNITVSMMSEDQDFGLNFINDLILVADQYAKEYLILKSQAIIDGTHKQLAVSRNSAISASLANTINGQYLKIATLENDMPYHIYFIDPPYSSEYPVSPNTFAIFLSDLIIFVVLSIMFRFIRDSKDDLW